MAICPKTDHLGKKHKSFKAMCAAWGMPNSTVYARLNKYGFSLKDALEIKKSRGHTRQIVVNGKHYPTLRQLCREYGVSENTFQYRRKQGDDIVEALRPANSRRPIMTVDHLGNKFANRYALCRHYNINYNTFKHRLERWDNDIKRALTTPVQHQHFAGTPSEKKKKQAILDSFMSKPWI